jgi:hypothetical protein
VLNASLQQATGALAAITQDCAHAANHQCKQASKGSLLPQADTSAFTQHLSAGQLEPASVHSSSQASGTVLPPFDVQHAPDTSTIIKPLHMV